MDERPGPESAELRSEVSRYLRAVAAEAAELPAFFPDHLQGEEGFDRLYQCPDRLIERGPLRAALELVGPDGEEMRSAGKPGDLPEEQLSVPWLGLDSLPARRIVLLGEAGGGKSWVLRGETRRLALDGGRRLVAGELPAEAVILPLRVSVAELSCGRGAIADRLLSLARLDEPPSLRCWARQQLKSGCCVVMLDGWDEAAVDRVAAARMSRSITQFVEMCPRVSLVIASRPLATEMLPSHDATLYEVPRWDVGRQLQFARSWCQGETAGLLTAIYTDPRVREASRNPLLLALLCGVWRRDRSSRLTPGGLLEACLHQLLARCLPHDLPGTNVESALEALGAAAFTLFDAEPESFTATQLAASLDAADGSATGRFGAAWLLSLTRVGLLAEAGTGRLRFLHQRFYEYLAARGLAARPDARPEILRRAWDPRWREVLGLCGGLLDDRVAEVGEALLRESRRDLFWRPLVLAARFLAETRDRLPERLVRQFGEELAARIEASVADWHFWSGPIQSVILTLASWEQAREDVRLRLRRLAARGGEAQRRVVAELLPLLAGETLTETLLLLAGDPDPDTRGAAAARLGSQGDLRCLEALIVLAGDEVPSVRAAAAVALGEEGGELARKALQVLAADEVLAVRLCAVEALGRDGDSRGEDAALRLLHDGGPHAEIAATALGRMRAASAFEPLRALAMVLSAQPRSPARRSPLPEFAAELRAVIEALGPTGGAAAVGPLRELARAEEPALRRPAILALARMRQPDAAEALLDLAEDTPRPTLELVEALAALGDERSVPTLSRWAWDVGAPRWVRAEAVRVLGTLGARALPHLLLLLRGEVIFPSVQAAAALAIGRQGAEEAREPLAGLLSSGSPTLRLAAARGLAEMGDSRADAELRRWVHHRIPAIRVVALTAQGRGDATSTTRTLLAALADPAPDVRSAALEALRRIGDRERGPICDGPRSLLRRTRHRLLVTWNETDAAPHLPTTTRRPKVRAR